MKKRLLSLVLVISMLVTILPQVSLTAQATDEPEYKKAVLNVDLTKIRQVGCQSGGQACACFALAYCTTILDGTVHYYSEYNLGTNQNDATCGWDRGKFTNGYYPSSITTAYKYLYNQIQGGNPVVIRVSGKRFSHHYVAVVGVENVTSYESLSPSNFLILDSGVSKFAIENMGTAGYDLKLGSSGTYQIVYNSTGKTAKHAILEENCDHSYSNVGVCSKCGAEYNWQSTYNTDCAGTYKVTYGDGVFLRTDKPYSASTAKSELIQTGTTVSVLGCVTNHYQTDGVYNKWYKVSYNGVIGYTYHDHLTFVDYFPQQITCTITSPVEGASFQEKPTIKGTVTSKNYPVYQIDAFFDGNYYATVHGNGKYTVSLQGTAIDTQLPADKMTQGEHWITLKVKDTKRSQLTKVIQRNFYIGESLCVLSFDSSGGSYVDSIAVSPGSTVTLPNTIPERFGYNFGGWQDGKGDIYQPGYSWELTGDITMTAVWTGWDVVYEDPTQFVETIDYPGTGVYFNFSVPHTGDYRFKGCSSIDTKITIWNSSGVSVGTDDDSGGNYQFQLDAYLQADKVYSVYVEPYSDSATGTLSWSVTEGYLGVWYEENVNGTVYVVERCYEYLTDNALFETTITDYIPEKSGYVFQGWSTEPNAKTAMYYAGDKVALEYENGQTPAAGDWKYFYPVWGNAAGVTDIDVYVNKTTYRQGTMFDWESLEIVRYYSNGNVEAVGVSDLGSGYSISGFDSNVVGKQTVTFHYGNFSKSFEIEVVAGGSDCGDNLEWELVDGVLTISGTGEMYDYVGGGPWNQYDTEITKVIISEGVTSIGNTAFYNLVNCRSVELPLSLTSIGKEAFVCCEALEYLILPYEITIIEDGTFAMCSSLKTIYIPNLVKEIGESAFYECTVLENVYYGGNVAEWGCVKFGTNNDALENVTVTYSTLHTNGWDYPESEHNYANNLNQMQTFTYPVAPGGLTIKFSAQTELENKYDKIYIYDGDGVEVGVYTGTELTNASVYVPGDTVQIQLVTDVSTRRYGYSIDYIIAHREPAVSGTCGDNLVWAVDNYGTSLTISGSGPMSEDVPWNSYSATIKKLVIGDGVTTVSDFAFKGFSSLLNVGFPNSVTEIGQSAFYNCSALTYVCIPNSVTTIGLNAFRGCTGLRQFLMDADNPAYSNDQSGALFNKDKTKLIQVPSGISGTYNVPDSVTTIGDYAFENCAGLQSVTIPDSVTSVGVAFSGCTNLNYTLYDGVKYLGNSENPYHVLVGPVSADISSCTVHQDTKIIADDAYRNCTNLTNVELPKGLAVIGDSAFKKTGLQSITIPNSVTRIKSSAFQGCTNLQSAVISNSVTEIGGYTFQGCTALNSITIPDSVREIGYYAFEACTGLQTVVLGENLTKIDKMTFNYCTGLQSVTMGDNVTTIDARAFSYCTSLKSVNIPVSVTYIGIAAFHENTALTDVYYDGLQAQWEAIVIEDSNETLTGATIHFAEPEITQVAINTLPAKLEYAVGETLDLTGMTLTATYSDGSIEIITEGFTASNFSSEIEGEYNVTVNYENFYVGFIVTITPPVLTGITVKTQPAKTEYEIGEELDTTGLTLSATYSDGSAQTIVSSFEVSGFDSTTAGTKTVTVTYQGKTATFTVLVHEPEETTPIEPPVSMSKALAGGVYGKNLIWILDEDGTMLISGNGSMEVDYGGPMGIPYPWRDFSNLVQRIIIESGVTTIAGGAFSGCSNLQDVYYTGSQEQWAGITVGSSNDYLLSATMHYACILENVPSVIIGSGTCNREFEAEVTWTLNSNGTLVIAGPGSMENYQYGPSNVVAPWLNLRDFVKNVVIEYGVANIGDVAFNNCDNLQNVYYTGTESQWESVIIGTYNAPLRVATKHFEHLHTYVDGVCIQCFAMETTPTEPITNGTCGENLTWIYDDGTLTISGTGPMEDYFYGPGEIPSPWGHNNSSIEEIVIESGVTAIGKYAFYGFSALKSISIPDSVTTIGKCAFHSCTEMASVTVPASIISVGWGAFENCISLQVVYYTGTQQQWDAITVETYNDELTGATIHFAEAELTGITVKTQPAKTEYEIGEELDTTGLTLSATYSDGSAQTIVSSFEVSGFDSTTAGTKTVTVTYQGKTATVTVLVHEPEETTPIEPPVPEETTPTEPSVPDANIVDSGTYGDNLTWTLDDEGVLTISGIGPMKTRTSANDIPWSGNIETVVIASGVTTVGEKVFAMNTTLTNVELSETVVSISASAFTGCSGLTTVSIPSSVTTIADSAFFFCRKLANVYYGGTQQQWNAIAVGEFNDELTGATIHFAEAELTGITVKTQPAKTEYEIGEELDTTGLTLIATYSDGSTETITEGFVVSGFDSETAGEKQVTITYRDFSAVFTATVKQPEPEKCPGDFTEDDRVTNEDVVCLLWHALFPEDYPINANGDFTEDGQVTNDDVVKLLWYALFPEDYPLQ